MARYDDRHHVDFPHIAVKFKNSENYLVSGENTCFISLTHKRKLEKANQVEIHMQFAPGSTQLYDSANKFEKDLVSHLSELIFEYGYVGKAHLSYETLITDYTLGMSGGFLEYTLSGISEITAANYMPITFVYPKTQAEAASMNLENLVDRLNTLVQERYNETYINDSNYQAQYEVKLDSNVDSSQFSFEGIDYYNPIELTDTSLMGLIRNVIKKVNASQQSDSVAFLTVFLKEDTSEKDTKKIMIKQEKFTIANDEKNYKVQYDFLWNHKDANVINWTPSFSGKVAIFGFRGQQVSYLTPTGKIQTYEPQIYMPTSPQSVTSDEVALLQNRIDNWWLEMARLPYKASLEVFGNPNMNCLLADYIKIQAYLGTDLHHSSGIYMITGITDTISSQGFLTSYDLLKIDAVEQDELVPVNSKKILTKTSTTTSGSSAKPGLPSLSSTSSTTEYKEVYKQNNQASKILNKNKGGSVDFEYIN